MYHLPIEREIHLLLLRQFLEKAAVDGMSQRSLADHLGVTEVHLSRLKRGGKDWRALTPEMARKIMERLNYRASQIEGVESMLNFFKERRTRRRHVSEVEGLNSIQMQHQIIDKKNHPAVVLSLMTKRSGPVGVVILCNTKRVEFYGSDNQKVRIAEAAKQLMPRKRDTAMLLAKIHAELWDECWKAVAADLDYFDADKGALKGKARLLRLDDALGTAIVTEKAADVFDGFCATLIERAK